MSEGAVREGATGALHGESIYLTLQDAHGSNVIVIRLILKGPLASLKGNTFLVPTGVAGTLLRKQKSLSNATKRKKKRKEKTSGFGVTTRALR